MALLQMVLLHSFLWLSNIQWYVYYIFFMHSSISGFFGCFHVFANGSGVAMNIGIHVSFQIMFFSRYVPKDGIAGS